MTSGLALPGVAGAQPAPPAPSADPLQNVIAAQALLGAARDAHRDGDPATAMQRLEAILSLEFPPTPDAQRLAGGTCLLLADIQRELGNLPGAKAAALDGVRRCGAEPGPIKVELLRGLAAICTDLGETAEAARFAEQAESQDRRQ